MDSTLTYKGYTGSVLYSMEDGVFHGKVLGVHALISYEGDTEAALVEDFHEAVDDYLLLCEEEGVEPEKPGI